MRANETGWIRSMDRKYGGTFSLGYQSVQLQLKALLEGVGGEQAVKFLDALSHLDSAEQEIVLRSCSEVLKQLKADHEHLSCAGNAALKDFEERLYRSIVQGIRDVTPQPKLEVAYRKKNPLESHQANTIDLAEARRLRALRRSKPLLN